MEELVGIHTKYKLKH